MPDDEIKKLVKESLRVLDEEHPIKTPQSQDANLNTNKKATKPSPATIARSLSPFKIFLIASGIVFLFVVAQAYIESKERNIVTTTDSYSSSTTNSTSNTHYSKWFQGGTLHKATVAQWKRATYRNKLATASDWLATTKWKGHLNSIEDFNRLKTKAQILVRGVDKVVAGEEMKQLEFMKAAEIAVGLLTLSNDFGP